MKTCLLWLINVSIQYAIPVHIPFSCYFFWTMYMVDISQGNQTSTSDNATIHHSTCTFSKHHLIHHRYPYFIALSPSPNIFVIFHLRNSLVWNWSQHITTYRYISPYNGEINTDNHLITHFVCVCINHAWWERAILRVNEQELNSEV